MSGTPPGQGVVDARTPGAARAAPPSSDQIQSGKLAPQEPVRPQQGLGSGTRVFRKSGIPSEEGGTLPSEQGQPHQCKSEWGSTHRQSVEERVAALPKAQVQRWLGNAVRDLVSDRPCGGHVLYTLIFPYCIF